MNKKLPKRARTLSNKIRLDNPWNIGKELGNLIDLHWDSVKQTKTLDADWFREFCAKHCLSDSYVISVIEKSYL